MDDLIWVSTLAGIVRTASPILIAAQGELLTERAGVVNLSLNGSIMLSAAVAFVVALSSGSIILGIGAAMLVGAIVALIIMLSSMFLKLDQIAVGFVLTLFTADLAIYVGRDYTVRSGQDVEIPVRPIPLLKDIPIFGDLFFNHNLVIYFSMLLVIMVWFWMYHTRFGLELRGLGERPQAAYVRGTRVQAWRFFYVILGGALVGLAGASYSLSVKLGWKETSSPNGQGWIALAIVIFGAWRPYRVAMGAYLIVGLRKVAEELQGNPVIDVPIQIANMVPWILMLFTLMFVSSGLIERFLIVLPQKWRPAAQRFLQSSPPAALGTNFEKD